MKMSETNGAEATTILKPGVLVVVKSSVRGGVENDRQPLSADGVDPAGAQQVRAWSTVQSAAAISWTAAR